jgi:hypothetical protein
VPQPTFFDTPTDNRGLFSDYYLEGDGEDGGRFASREDVVALQEEADETFEDLRELYQERRSELEGANERQTEKRFLEPVLERLGWASQPQVSTQNLGQRSRPDYALFTSKKIRSDAVAQHGADGDGLYSRAAAFGEAKRWGRPLDRGGGTDMAEAMSEGDPLSKGTPALQVVGYFVTSGLDWGILTNGARWRIYYAGAPSRMDTFYEVNLEHIFRLAGGDESEQEEARKAFLKFYALFRAEAFAPSPLSGEPFIEDVLEASDTFGAELEEGLKSRIYDDVFLKLAQGLYESIEAREGEEAAEASLDDIYRGTLRLLYRLLFLLYAEARGLLPLQDELGYFQYSLTRVTGDAAEMVAEGQTLSRRSNDIWNDLESLFRIVSEGDPDLDVPKYNGGLFELGWGPNAFLDAHGISDKRLVPALVALTRQGKEPEGPRVDFKALDVRQLGSIYEGLLEHRLVRTDDGLDLLTDEGERKETGSYYTPHYIVEYIVEETLGPVVDERVGRFEEAMEELQGLEGSNGHGERAEELREEAFEALFGLKACDPAMGSGHFLVQATDYLADRFSDAIGRYPDNPVVGRLEEIRNEILEELGDQGVEVEDPGRSLSDTALLRRLVMKRCIYGVDLNPMAVELAKLSLWLRSFTVGAPLSFLDHHLRAGNSLIGASVEEVKAELEANGEQNLFDGPFSGLLEITELMQGVARKADATLQEVQESAERFAEYEEAAEPYRKALDVWVSRAFGNDRAADFLQEQGSRVLEIFRGKAEPKGEAQEEVIKTAQAVREEHHPFHWELEFPEVYFDLEAAARRENPGFDAVVGNPPYVRIQSLSGDSGRGMYFNELYEAATGKYDLYTLFVEQGCELLGEEGILGTIVPNKFFQADYGEGLRGLLARKKLLHQVVDFGSNQVFDGISTYTQLLFLQQDDSRTFHFTRASPDELGETSFEEIEEDVLDSSPWNMAYGESGILLDELLTSHPTLEEYTRELFQGIITGGDDHFILSVVESRDSSPTSTVRRRDSGETFEVEDDLLRPFVKGNDVRAYRTDSGRKVLFYPYRENEEGKTVLISESDLEVEYPEGYQYLTEFRDALSSRGSDSMTYESWYAHWCPRSIWKFEDAKIITPVIAKSGRFYSDGDQLFFNGSGGGGGGAYGIVLNEKGVSQAYVTSILNSELSDFVIRLTSSVFRGEYYAYNRQYIKNIPICEIDFTTPNDERETHIDTLIDHLEAVRPEGDRMENAVLGALSDHLDAGREDVVHDFLVLLAQEMKAFKGDRQAYNLDITDYVPEPSEEDGVSITEIGRYQPAEGAADSVLSKTTESREKLRIGRLKATVDDDGITVQATARFKPEGGVSESELDTYGYYETAPIDFCVLADCSDEEQKLVRYWLEALNGAESGFAGYREGAGTTISLRDRLFDLRLPDLDQRSNELAPFFRNVEEASSLDAKIGFTDELIDQIVYRLYGLTEDEIEVVEKSSLE